MARYRPVLVHVPKAGSTTLRKSIPGVKSPVDHHVHLPLSHKLVQAQLRERETAVLIGSCRDPYARAVSCFHYWRVMRPRKVLENSVLEAVCNLEGMTCDEFYARANLALFAKVIPHFATQMSILQRLQEYDVVVRVEEMEAGLNRALKRIGCRALESTPRLLATPHGSPSEELSEASARRIRDFYAVDFDELGYATDL